MDAKIGSVLETLAVISACNLHSTASSWQILLTHGGKARLQIDAASKAVEKTGESGRKGANGGHLTNAAARR